MITRGMVGAQTLTDNAPATMRMDKQGAVVVSKYHGPYHEMVSRGKVFQAASQAVVTTTVGLATTYTGFVLSNPISSTVNLEILQASMMQSVIQATQIEAFALATGFNSASNVTHTTPLTVKSALIGSAATGYGVVDSSATLPTAPTYDTFLTNTATATQNSAGLLVFDVGGAIVLAPGAYVAFVTPTQASVNGMWFGMKWAEHALA